MSGLGHRPRTQLSVQACDGCCCGTTRKHPGVDHASQREQLAAAAHAAGGRYRTVECVGECSFSNVVIVRRGSRRWWVGHVLDEKTEQELCSWIQRGAQGTPPPEVLDRCFHPATAPQQPAGGPAPAPEGTSVRLGQAD